MHPGFKYNLKNKERICKENLQYKKDEIREVWKDSFMLFSKYIDNFTPFPPLLDSNMFSSLLQKRNKFMKPRGGWRGGRGVLLYQNQVIIFQEVQLYIFQY